MRCNNAVFIRDIFLTCIQGFMDAFVCSKYLYCNFT